MTRPTWNTYAMLKLAEVRWVELAVATSQTMITTSEAATRNATEVGKVADRVKKQLESEGEL